MTSGRNSLDLETGVFLRGNVSRPNAELVQEMAVYAAVYYNLRSTDEFAYKVTKVVDVQTTINRGVVYSMDVLLGRTHCPNGRTPNLESCALFSSPPEAQTLRCHFVVLNDLLDDQKRLLDSSCTATTQ
ncbi:cystatin-like [Alosa alosa]|uniref:cystatin-like n=1 Tax=Alosa alosa TaxID=278164 RepID=UPI00201507D0|nr:cystatin-like [Alosa alosa]